MPFRADNAIVKAAEVVRRIAGYRPRATMHEAWRRFLDAADLPPEVTAALGDPDGVGAFVDAAPDAGLARMVHACTHTMFAPTVFHGGVKTNVIPDTADLQVDIRTLPGQSGRDVRAMLNEALGDLAGEVEIAAESDDVASESAVDTPLSRSLAKVSAALVPGSSTVPFMLTGATDARFFRRMGAVAYGSGLFSERISFAEFASMFHGDNERVDLESLDLVTRLWEGVLEDFLL